jgi:hypothetical protein
MAMTMTTAVERRCFRVRLAVRLRRNLHRPDEAPCGRLADLPPSAMALPGAPGGAIAAMWLILVLVIVFTGEMT